MQRGAKHVNALGLQISGSLLLHATRALRVTIASIRGMGGAAPSPVDCPAGEFARPADGFESPECGRAATESPPESTHQKAIYLA